MPDWKPEIRQRLAGLKLAPTREAAIVEELAHHLDDCYAESLASGGTSAEAARKTRAELNGSELLAAELRRVERRIQQDPIIIGTTRRGNMFSDLWQDLRYGARMLTKHKGFTAVAVLSLALGIGANTAIFSLIDAVLLKMLPVEQPEQLYFIQNVGPRRPDGGAPPYPCFERFVERNKSFTGLVAFNAFEAKLKIDGQIEEVRSQRVSGNYFALLGVNAILGRAISASDDTVPGQGGPDGLVAMISYNYWTRRFGQEPSVIGKVVHVDDQPVTIIGVTPRDFFGLIPGRDSDVSLPMAVAGRALAQRESWWFQAAGRLKPGIPLEQARVELDDIFQSYMNETGMNAEARREAFNRIDLRSASRGLNSLRQQFSKPLQALMAIVALVLLIACANVANLLLARAAARRKEFAVRLALGASRFRLLRQVLAESLLLATLGGLVGLLFARWGSTFLAGFVGSGRARVSLSLPLDYRVLSFTFGVAVLTGLVFGLAPALHATRLELNSALKDSAGRGTRSRSRFGKSLVAAQVAVSLLLLVGAGLFLRTLYNLKTIDPGFRPSGVVTMRVNPPAGMAAGERVAAMWKDILARVERVPGVESATLTTLSPLDGSDRGVAIDVAGFRAESDQDRGIRMNQVSAGYFQTFGVPVLQGRTFTDSDTETAPRVALFNEAAARFYFGDRSPIGAQIQFHYDRRHQQAPPPYEIVGVVKDSRYENLRQQDTRLIYLPLTQARDRLGRLTLAVRSDGSQAELTTAVTREVRAAGTEILLTNIGTLSERVNESLLQERLVATLSLFFAFLALLLACIGLYGVMSYDIARRTSEIGIRMALGANARRVIRLVLRETMSWVAMGVALGLIATVATTRLLESLLFGLKPHDPLIIGAAALVLLMFSAVAGYLPARRAARVDPLVALRRE